MFCVAGNAFSPGMNKKIDSLNNVLTTAKEDTIKAAALNALSLQYWMAGDFDKSLKYGKEALELSRKINFKGGIASAYNKIVLTYG